MRYECFLGIVQKIESEIEWKRTKEPTYSSKSLPHAKKGPGKRKVVTGDVHYWHPPLTIS